MILKPWDERKRSLDQAEAAAAGQAQQDRGDERLRVLAAAAAGSIGGLPVQMVINSTGDFQRSTTRWTRSRTPRARAACSSSSTAISPSTSRRCGSMIDRSKANELGITMQQIGDYAGAAGRRKLRQPLQPRGPLLRGDPAGAAGRPADAGDADAVLRHRRPRASRCRCRTWSSIKTDDRAQRADPLQPAQLGDLPGGADAGRDDGPGGRFPRRAGRRTCRPGSATTTCRIRGNTCRRATSSSSPSSSR